MNGEPMENTHPREANGTPLRRRWWFIALAFLLIPIWAPLLLVYVVAVFALIASAGFVGLIWSRGYDVWVMRRMRLDRRRATVEEVQQELDAGRGTLLLERVVGGCSTYLWFTRDNVKDACPVALPSETRDPKEPFALDGPFARWAMPIYIDKDTGKAQLVCTRGAERVLKRIVARYPDASCVSVLSGLEASPEIHCRNCGRDLSWWWNSTECPGCGTICEQIRSRIGVKSAEPER